jgi:hypothetical protein
MEPIIQDGAPILIERKDKIARGDLAMVLAKIEANNLALLLRGGFGRPLSLAKHGSSQYWAAVRNIPRATLSVPSRWFDARSLHSRFVFLRNINAGGGNNAYHREYRGEYEEWDTSHRTLPVPVGNAALTGAVPRCDRTSLTVGPLVFARSDVGVSLFRIRVPA